MTRRTFIVGSLAAAASSGAAGPAAAAVAPFDPQAFAAAQAAGEGVVVFVHAPW
jgi:hypothetical protein